MNYEEAINYLVSRQGLTAKGGLPGVRAALERLGNPQRKFKTVHVTGTNGKGSVCALFDSALRAAGYRTGLFISPHIVNFTERLQFCGEEIPKDRLAEICGKCAEAGPDLSFFELLTVMAFQYFAEENADIAVIEAGIGGRLDSTNVLENPVLCVITSVDLDHAKQLGNTIRSVAYNKAGIIKKNGILIAPDSIPAEAKDEILKETYAQNAKAVFVPSVFEPCGYDWQNGTMNLRHKLGGAVFPYSIMGDAQSINASLLWEGIEFLSKSGLNIGRAAAAQAFRRVRWPGRFQIVHSGAEFHNAVFVLDGAHNPQAAESFCKTWKKTPFVGRNPVYVIAMLNDKDRISVLKQISQFEGKFYFTMPATERAVPPETLRNEFLELKPGCETYCFNNPEDAIRKASENGTVAVLGSFYLAGEALKLLKYN